jgi:hypothetical protein
MNRTFTQRSVLLLGVGAILALPLAGCDTQTSKSSTTVTKKTDTPDATVKQTTTTESKTTVTPK